MFFMGKSAGSGKTLTLRIPAKHGITVYVPRNQIVTLLYNRKPLENQEILVSPCDRCLSVKDVTLKLLDDCDNEPWQAELIKCCKNDQVCKIWISAVMLPDDQFRPFHVETDAKHVANFRQNLFSMFNDVKFSDMTIVVY